MTDDIDPSIEKVDGRLLTSNQNNNIAEASMIGNVIEGAIRTYTDGQAKIVSESRELAIKQLNATTMIIIMVLIFCFCSLLILLKYVEPDAVTDLLRDIVGVIVGGIAGYGIGVSRSSKK